MRPIIRLSALLLFLLLSVSVAQAKAIPDKITVTGPGLTNPLEITDPEILEASNPWAGEFVDWDAAKITETPPVNRRYEILVHLRDRNDSFRVIYAFHYAPDPSGGRGYIYLPGMDDQWYDVNVGTIVRPSGWQRASAQWDAIMDQTLAAARPPSGPARFGPLAVRGIQSRLLLALALLAASGGIALWLARTWRTARA